MAAFTGETGLSQIEILHRIRVGVAADTGDTGISQDEILYEILGIQVCHRSRYCIGYR